MHFAPLAFIASLVAVTLAQSDANPFNNPNGGYQLTAGKPTTLTWKPTTKGTVTLTLRSGASSALDKGVVLASSIPNSGSASVTPPSDTVRNSDYTIEISSDDDPKAVNYTPPLVVESSNTVESASSAAASATKTSAASASASASESTKTGSSATTKSASTTASNTRSTSASTGSASGSAASAEAAPTGAAMGKNQFNVQGGLAAVILGAAVLL